MVGGGGHLDIIIMKIININLLLFGIKLIRSVNSESMDYRLK